MNDFIVNQRLEQYNKTNKTKVKVSEEEHVEVKHIHPYPFSIFFFSSFNKFSNVFITKTITHSLFATLLNT